MSIFKRKHKTKKHRFSRSSSSSSTLDDLSCCCIVGEVFDDVGDCFVATAANNDNLVAPQVTTLRAYRDQRLARYRAGRLFTRYYYRWGRYPARFLRANPRLKPVVRAILRPIAYYASKRVA